MPIILMGVYREQQRRGDVVLLSSVKFENKTEEK
jgi:hypothetical protein